MRVFLITLLFIPTINFAQDTISKSSFGISMQYGASVYKNDIEAIRCEKHEINYKSAFQATLNYQYQPVSWFSLVTGLGYHFFSTERRNYCNSDQGMSTFYPVGTPGTSIKFDFNYYINIHSIHLPLLFQFSYKGLELSLGIQSNLLLGGTYKFQRYIEYGKIDDIQIQNGFYHNRFIWGGLARLGYNFNNKVGLFFQFYHSLHDINSNGNPVFSWKKEWLQQFSFGAKFYFLRFKSG